MTGGAGFIGSNLTLALQEKFPDARSDGDRRFSLRRFQESRAATAAISSRKIWRRSIGRSNSATKSSTQFFISPRSPTRRITISSPGARQRGKLSPPPGFRAAEQDANRLRLLGFDLRAGHGGQRGIKRRRAGKHLRLLQSDHGQSRHARRARESPDWIIVGLRYFNVYGPREAHKGVPASMIYHLVAADESRPAPAHFQTRRTEARFRLREGRRGGNAFARSRRSESGIYNLGCGQARSFNELIDILNESLRHKSSSRITSIIRTPIIKISPRRI